MKVCACCLGAILSATILWPAETMAAPDSIVARRWLDAAHVAPDFRVPTTSGAWESKRQELRATLSALLGTLPPRPPIPAVRIRSRESREGYLLEKFEFDNGAGDTVPGCLLIPAGLSAKAPAVLYCHWHGGQYDVGKDELFRTNATPVPAGPALAARGYVVCAIDASGFGERNGRGPGGSQEQGGAGEMTASKFNLWVGRTLWGMMVRDDRMALDYLCSRPEVDPRRIGVTGISMGATRTWWLMALDDRPKAGVAVGCLTRYQNLIREEGLKYHGIYYFVPNLLQHFDVEAVVALIAPRPILFMTGDQDFGSPTEGLRIIEQRAKPAWELYGQAGEFQNLIYPGVGHVYLPAMWDKTLEWMDKKLK
jgi:dipeptidyl aminopeptidase/acylaminoacyl peptidase